MAFSLQIKTVVAEEADSTDEISFYENLSEAEFSDGDTITVLIEFDYPENDYDVRETDSLESSQEKLRLLRASNKAYYTENNQEFIDDLDIEYDDMDVSAYSPYVFVTFDTWDEYADARDDLIELSEDDKVKKVFAEETPVMEDQSVTVNSSYNNTPITLDEAYELIGVKDENGTRVSNYTGSGIRIGVIEYASPDDLTNFQNNEIKGICPDNNVLTSDHSTKVSSIIGGTYGVAPGAELYYAGNFSQVAIEWLLSDEVNVNVINMSSAVSSSAYPYNGYDAYTDYISRQNNILFVKASGNITGNTTASDITHPGLGLNVLCVGSTDALGNVSSFSASEYTDAFLRKPNFVAPGEGLIIPNEGSNNYGTSLSTPMVTGIIALLMEEFSDYILYPELIAAALINGCELLPGQTEIWEAAAGAGMVNYSNARSIFSDQRFDTIGVDSTRDETYILLECEVKLRAGESLTYCLFDLIKPNQYNIYSEDYPTSPNLAVTPNITNYTVKVFSPSGTVIHTGTSDNNIVVGKVSNLPSTGTYYIRVYMDGTKNSTSREYLALTYSTNHTHSYTYSCTSSSKIGHICKCVCGESISELHNFQQGIDGGQYCTRCGYTKN